MRPSMEPIPSTPVTAPAVGTVLLATVDSEPNYSGPSPYCFVRAGEQFNLEGLMNFSPNEPAPELGEQVEVVVLPKGPTFRKDFKCKPYKKPAPAPEQPAPVAEPAAPAAGAKPVQIQGGIHVKLIGYEQEERWLREQFRGGVLGKRAGDLLAHAVRLAQNLQQQGGL